MDLSGVLEIRDNLAAYPPNRLHGPMKQPDSSKLPRGWFRWKAKLHGGVLRATPNASNDDRQYHGDLSEDHACDIRSGRSAKIEKHLSAPLGVKNRFAQ